MNAVTVPPNRRHWPGTRSGLLAGIGLGLLVLAATVVVGGLRLRQHIRAQLAQRDGEILDAVAAMQYLDDKTSDEMIAGLDDPGEQLQLALKISRLRNVLGVRLFSPEGKFVNALPAYITEATLPPEDLAQLRDLKPVSHFLPRARLEEQDLLAGSSGTRVALLEVNVPLHEEGQWRLAGVAQFLMSGASIARNYAELDRRVALQSACVFVLGGSILAVGLVFAFRRVRHANQLLAERTANLLKANTDLALAAKTSAVGAVASHLIHGLRNPLSGLQHFVQDHASDEGNGHDADWQMAVATTRRMESLINRVVQVIQAQQTTADYEVSLAELAEMLAAKQRPAAQSAGVRLETTVSGEGLLANREADLVLLILENLLQNAIEATPADKTVRLAIARDGDHVRMEVQDEGPGLPAEVAANLFAPCVSSKKRGSGIGLAISRQLAKHLGAELDLEQSSSQGCVFRLVLPLQPKPSLNMKHAYSGALTLLALLAACLVPRDGSAQQWRWSNPTPHGNDILDMAWNGSLSVQVADTGQIYTSSGFYGWFPQNSGTTNTLLAVKFFGNRIVYAGANGTVGYSDDGVNFHTANLSTPEQGDWLVDLAPSSNLVVAVGDNAIIYTSPDGANWHYQGKAPNNPSDHWLLSAAWGAGTFVITGEGGYIATSVNGTTWTLRTSPVADDLDAVNYISTTNPASLFPYTGFWAVSDDLSGGSRAIYSTNNCVTWYQFSLALNTNTLYAIAANPTTGLVAGDSEVQLGTGATSWKKQTLLTGSPMPAPVWPYYDALWDTTNLAYRLVGEDGMMVESTTTNSDYDWQESFPDVARDLLWQVALAGDLYVAVGDNTRIMTSQNGIDWSIEAIPLTNSVLSPYSTNIFFCVGGTTNLLVAAGTRGCLAVSPNNPVTVVLTNLDGTLSTNVVGALGVLWYPMPAPTANDLAGVCVFNNKFYLTGASGTLLSSPDGTNWTRISVPVSADLSGLAASSNMMVLTGDQGQILSSPNGSTWTQRPSGTTNGLVRVRYLGGYFLIVGENGTILKSADGTSWSSVASGTTNWLNDAVMVSNTCYIVGNNNTVLTSANFINWTNIGTITTLSLYGAATQNGQLLAVGLEGTILRAQIVPDLSPLTILSYGQADGENVFVVSGDPDQEFTLDSSTNLVNWTTGPLLDLIYGSGTLTFLTQVGSNPPPTQFYRATLH